MKKRTIGFLAILVAIVCLGAATDEKMLIDQDITVLRGDFKEVHFLMPEEGQWVLEGDFKCTGGMNDDITLLALTQPAYVRWFSHYDYKAETKLIKQKEGRFRVDAKPGETYYFVFDNFFSSVSNKKIHIRVKQIPR